MPPPFRPQQPHYRASVSKQPFKPLWPLVPQIQVDIYHGDISEVDQRPTFMKTPVFQCLNLRMIYFPTPSEFKSVPPICKQAVLRARTEPYSLKISTKDFLAQKFVPRYSITV